MAHEIGHNLGMDHDFHSKHTRNRKNTPCEKDSHLMGYPKNDNLSQDEILEGQREWSSCSRRDFVQHYQGVSSNLPWCMEAKGRN